MRTEFGQRPSNRRYGVISFALGVALLCGIVVTSIWFGYYPLRLTLVVIVALALTAYGIYVLVMWGPTYRLSIGAHGIDLQWRGARIALPWTDMEYWWLGVPADSAGRAKGGVGRVALLVRPAGHVTDPTTGPRRMLWSSSRERWTVCEPDLTDGNANEIAAAMRHFAGQLEAHLVRSSESANGLARAGEVDADLQTVIAPSPVLLPKAVNATVLSALFVGFPIAAFGVAAGVDTGGDPGSSSSSEPEWGLVGIGLVFAVAWLVLVVVTLYEAAYLWSVYLNRRVVSVTGSGFVLRRGAHTTTLPWSDVASWSVAQGSRRLTFFMGVRRHPNPAVRVPVRDIILLRPASHVQPSGTGDLKALWSRHQQAWVICKVVHTNLTTAEICGVLRRFAPGKETAAQPVQR